MFTHRVLCPGDLHVRSMTAKPQKRPPARDIWVTRGSSGRCSSSRRSQQGNSLATEQLVRLGNLFERCAPIEHGQEMSGAHGSALLDDVLRNIVRRAGDELVLA